VLPVSPHANRAHIAVTYHWKHAWKIYVNGQLSGSRATTLDPLGSIADAPTASPRDAYVGCRRFGSNTLKGYFRDFRVYSRVLS
jgi:hypothetical protein